MSRVRNFNARISARVLVAITAGLVALGVTLSLVPVTAYVSEPSTAPKVSVQQSSRDVAVTSIAQVGPPFAHEGDTVVIQVGVTNNGSEAETFQVGLVDDTAGETIATQETTLEGMASTTLSLQWDTEGATGGPPPPGPPTPGTIHSLTATAMLEGDTDSTNNSMSLLPGIWIIAAPEPDGITFPESVRSPEATFGDDHPLEAPRVSTNNEALSELFVASEVAEAYSSLAHSGLSTSPESLESLFSTTTGSKQRHAISGTNVSTAQQGLEAIFTSASLQPYNSALAQPIISTVATEYIPVRFSDADAKTNLALSGPPVETIEEALDKVHFRQSLPVNGTSISQPNLTTPLEPLGKPFGGPAEARQHTNLTDPQIGTDAGETGRPLTLFEEASLYSAAIAPEIMTLAEPRSLVSHFPLVVDSSQALSIEAISTSKKPATRVNAWTVHSLYKEPLTVPSGTASLEKLAGIFAGGGPVTYRPAKSLVMPFAEASVRGRVLLEGSKDSLGAYVEIEGAVAFVDREGLFVAPAPDGAFDLYLRAPGHLSASVKGVQVEPGQTLQIPTVTLPFGDADGDELVDIYDLTVAARNYGQTTLAVSVP